MSKRMIIWCVAGVMVFGGMTTTNYARENADKTPARESATRIREVQVQAEKNADNAKEEAVARRSVGAKFELKGKTIDGNDFNWKDYQGKVVLIDFWASWCGPCIAEVPNMIAAYDKYKDKGFEIVGIGVGDATENLKQAQQNKNLTWVSLDARQTEKAGGINLADYYGIEGIPTMFVVGRDGKIIGTNTRGKTLMNLLQKELGE